MDSSKLQKRYEELVNAILSEHKQVFDAQQVSEIEQFMSVIIQANRICLAGAGREGIAARSFAMRLMHLGKEVHWVWDDTTPGMEPGDLFLAVNGSGKIGHIDYLVEQAKAAGAYTAVLTGAPNERIPREADLCLFVPACVYKGKDERAIPSMQPMGSLFEQHLFLLFDVIVLLLQEQLGMSGEQMEKRHRNVE